MPTLSCNTAARLRAFTIQEIRTRIDDHSLSSSKSDTYVVIMQRGITYLSFDTYRLIVLVFDSFSYSREAVTECVKDEDG